MVRFYAIIKKEFRQISRDKLSLGILIFVPALLLILYGYALSFDIRHIPTAVLDEDNTYESRQFLDGIFQNPYFDLKIRLFNRSQIDDLMLKGLVKAVVIVPKGFTEKIHNKEEALVQTLIDGTDSTTGSTVHGYMDLIVARFNHQILSQVNDSSISLIQIEPRIWFNPNLESSIFLVPGLIAMFLMLSSVIAASVSIVKEKERKTIEQIMVSPIHPYELIAGKTIPYIIICIITMAMALLLSYLLFGVVVHGSWFLLSFATLLFLFASLGMGMLISAITNSQQVALQIATLLTLLPSLLLSGLVFPIKNMPVIIQAVTLFVIPRHFVTILRGIIIRGADFYVLWQPFLAMFVLGFLFNILAILKLRKSL